MRHAPVERETGHVNQPLEAGRDLDEGAERLETANRALGRRSSGKALGSALPRIGCERAKRQADAPAAAGGIRLELHDLGFHRLADLEHFGGIFHARVTELAHVHERLDTADVDEGAEVAERSDGAAHHRAELEMLPRLPGFRRGLVLEELAA